LRNLYETPQASATLVIAHRLSTVMHADEIVVLDADIVVERGTHKTLIRAGGVYAALWEAQNLCPRSRSREVKHIADTRFLRIRISKMHIIVCSAMRLAELSLTTYVGQLNGSQDLISGGAEIRPRRPRLDPGGVL
jgi:hypothetical protein